MKTALCRALLALTLLLRLSSVDAEDMPVQTSTPTAPVPLTVPVQSELSRTLNGRDSAPSSGQVLLATETLFVLNSYVASIAPKIYGGAGIILLPSGVMGMQPGPERTTAFFLVEGLALYNLLGVDTDRMSEGEIFRANFVAWHGILVLNALVHHAVEGRTQRRRKIVLVPLRKGAAVQTAWAF